ncbi:MULTISPECIES: Crp/Fnr family transcriptional regulator [Bacillaceae]|uniref:Crp/Fnr family transcriptional regulator n=1 Tax=Evansella alkalicola TaxID=745819 RepID=A0ABS6JTH7_9BACI|nr:MULTISPECIES: Crp/Fnr family transcriptional regulator [Bacillaceae]MBU9721864.1 Crp/Fnr family transcriptional regulator [Bacillus alkalicola]
MNTTIQHRNTLFSDIPPKTWDELLEAGSVISMKKNSTLFYEGDPSEHIYYIKEGKIRITKMAEDGKVFYLQTKKDNDFIGETNLFNGLPHRFDAVVIQDSEIIRFDRLEIETIIAQDTDLAVRFFKMLSNENHTLLAHLRDLIFCGKQGAVLSILIRLSNEYGKEVSSGVLINRKITNQELANFVGATRESINRILKRLIKQNIISVNTKYITIHDMAFLKEHLRCAHCPFDECTI